MKRITALLLAFVTFTVFMLSNCSISENEPQINSFDNENLADLEDDIYAELTKALGGTDYIVENVEAIYVSQEYIEETLYNSRANTFFGYTLAELDAQFENSRYVFTLGDDNQTKVVQFTEYSSLFTKILQNMAIGTGVILICVTISLVTVAYAPTVSAYFMKAAKKGAEEAFNGTITGFIKGGIIEYIKTGDCDEAYQAALLEASEGYKWGAIIGVATGLLNYDSCISDYLGYLNDALDVVKVIQSESHYSLDFIRSVQSADEYEIYREAGLIEYRLDNQRVLLPEHLDLTLTDSSSRTNLQRLLDGDNPVDINGIEYEWHYVGNKTNAPLVLLTYDQYTQNCSVLSQKDEDVVKQETIPDRVFAELNIALAKMYSGY